MNVLRAWASWYTERGRFSPVGVALHWTMAALIFVQLGLGWVMSYMAVGGDKIAAYVLHGTIGVAIFLIAIFRLVWRIMIPDPFNDADTMGWKTKFAYLVEHLFYVCFLLLPITGWIMWSAVPAPGRIDVLFGWPQLPLDDVAVGIRWWLMEFASDFHLALVIILMLMIPLHVGAALKHHFWDHNDVVEGMLPQIPDLQEPPEGPMHKPLEPQSPAPSASG